MSGSLSLSWSLIIVYIVGRTTRAAVFCVRLMGGHLVWRQESFTKMVSWQVPEMEKLNTAPRAPPLDIRHR